MVKAKKTTKLKRFFSYKIYAWILILIVLLMSGFYVYGYFSGKSSNRNHDFQTGIMVKKLEKVQEVVFLNVGVQEIVPQKEEAKIGNFKIPNSAKKVIIILNYNIKLGIKSAVDIKKTGDKSYQLQLPPYDVIGIDFNHDRNYELYDESGELLSGFTKKIDTGKVVTDALNNKKKQRKYIKQYKDLINQSVENYYKTLFESIDEEIEIDFVFSD